MALDILGPANAVNSTTVRPSETRVFGPTDTFFKPCSSPSSLDGTALQAVFLNGVLQQLRRAIRGMGIAENNADDDMLLKAIQAAGAGYLSIADATTLLPIHAQVGSTGFINATPGTGTTVVATGQSIIHRGVRSYDLTLLSLANRTFNTSASKTYHLRWHAPGTGDATPASSWPAGRLVLKDLADGTYNPSALAETNTAFDTTYDNLLLQRIATNGSNALTVTNLLNLPLLYLDGVSSYTQSTPGVWSQDGNATLLCNHAIAVNWGRTPKYFAASGWVGIANSSPVPTMNGAANVINGTTTNRYTWTGTIYTDFLEVMSLINYYSTLMIKAVA